MAKNKTTKSPSLEVISREEVGLNYERRLLPRLSVTFEQFKLLENGKIFPVNDLSEKGMGLWVSDPRDLGLFAIGQEMEGVLNFRREKYKIRAKVKNIGKDRVGSEFAKVPKEFKEAFKSCLDPAFLGKDMKPVPADPGILWYHGPLGTDLLLRRDLLGQLAEVSLYVLGVFIHWQESSGLETGTLVESHQKSEVQGILRFESLILNHDPKLDSEKLRIAKTVILSSNISQDLKTKCMTLLER